MQLISMLLTGRQSGLAAHLPTGVPERPGTRLQPGGDVAGLLIWPWELRFIQIKLFGQLLLTEAMSDGRQVSSTPV
ncbi:hypothetical protein GGQ11_002905 [Salinibacter ruber]|jgi:hypothetical protein|uniref:hypothetical protein n=1 Tax=Salinibacter ruber TaxID=146919 RepID=UPI002168BC43|nr:hypothetical protein [Salinibacter ruber]MCS3651849.1 hypothetical protein [Salinibacter ruber]MCS3658104.1 hypothetical protein [Salinibacter ruber]MCS3824010.1 hypothetical protein [Salinibacter ruber]